jgi:hypothetical protein
MSNVVSLEEFDIDQVTYEPFKLEKNKKGFASVAKYKYPDGYEGYLLFVTYQMPSAFGIGKNPDFPDGHWSVTVGEPGIKRVDDKYVGCSPETRKLYDDVIAKLDAKAEAHARKWAGDKFTKFRQSVRTTEIKDPEKPPPINYLWKPRVTVGDRPDTHENTVLTTFELNGAKGKVKIPFEKARAMSSGCKAVFTTCYSGVFANTSYMFDQRFRMNNVLITKKGVDPTLPREREYKTFDIQLDVVEEEEEEETPAPKRARHEEVAEMTEEEASQFA